MHESGRDCRLCERALHRKLPKVDSLWQIAPDILMAHERIIEDSDLDIGEGDIQEPGLYDSSVDFWSTGVMLYEVSRVHLALARATLILVIR